MGVLGRAAFYFLHAAFGFSTVLLYPLYETKNAMEKLAFRDQQQQWLTYWILLSFLTVFELYLSSIISWIPLWPYIKMVFCLWLMMPSFKGAAYVYENIATMFMTIESEEKPMKVKEEKEEEVEVKEKAKAKEEKEDEVEVKEKAKAKAKDIDEEDDEDEEKKIFRAWKLVDDYIETNGADSLEQIVKSGLQATRTNLAE